MNPPKNTSQNPPWFKNILTNAPVKVNAIPMTIAQYGYPFNIIKM